MNSTGSTTARSFREPPCVPSPRSGWLPARAETSAFSHRIYENAIGKFLAYLGPQADEGLDEITRPQVAAFRDAQLAVSASATANIQLKVVKMLFRSARRDGFIFDDPAESVKPAKLVATFERRPFTIDELRAVLSVADDEWRSLIKFGLYTGQRLGDLALLTWSQIDLEREEIHLTDSKNRQATPPPDGRATARAPPLASER